MTPGCLVASIGCILYLLVLAPGSHFNVPGIVWSLAGVERRGFGWTGTSSPVDTYSYRNAGPEASTRLIPKL
jgi:hypothetical protein